MQDGSQHSVVTIQQLAAEFQIPVSWLYERSRHDLLPGQFRIGKYVRVDLAKFREALSNNWTG